MVLETERPKDVVDLDGPQDPKRNAEGQHPDGRNPCMSSHGWSIGHAAQNLKRRDY